MCWMAMKEGMRQGCMAVGMSVIVQAVLSINRQESFFRMFVVTDAIVVAACALFPVFILIFQAVFYLEIREKKRIVAAGRLHKGLPSVRLLGGFAQKGMRRV